jgi:hypothetical protein
VCYLGAFLGFLRRFFGLLRRFYDQNHGGGLELRLQTPDKPKEHTRE